MKFIQKISFLLLIALLFGAFSAVNIDAKKKKRKLPDSSYLTAAKIEIISGDTKRYKTAIALLDTLFMYYGHQSEGLNLMAQIQVDYIEKTSTPAEKKPHVIKMNAYFDSLTMACDNKELKKKYRKNCKKFVEKGDSTKVKFWQEFYNSGIEQLDLVREMSKDIEDESDSGAIAYAQETMNGNIDSCIANMELAIILDASKQDPYIATGNAYEYSKNYPMAIEWLKKGLDRVTAREKLLMPIFYDYFNMSEYCDAIPYIKEYTEIVPEDIGTKMNLAICYSNCNLYDSMAAVYRGVLADSSDHDDALTGMGTYYTLMAQNQRDSVNFYNKTENKQAKEKWETIWKTSLDSVVNYFQKVAELQPDNVDAQIKIGTYSLIKLEYKVAAEAFKKVTAMSPDEIDYWIYLGDCYIYLKDFKEAIPAYEGVVNLDPSRKDIWERLKDLHIQEGHKAKAAKIEKKLKNM